MLTKNSPYSYIYPIVVFLASTTAFITPSTTLAADKHWIGRSDYWTTDISWNPIGTPQNGDNVHILHSDSINRNIHYPHEPIPDLDLPFLEIDNDGEGHTKLVQEQNSLSVFESMIGILGSAQWEQSGGNNLLAHFYLGFEETGAGTYILENDAHLSTLNEYIGVRGAGEFIQLGGTNNVQSQTLVPFHSSTAYGYYEIHSGSFNSDTLHIGLRGTGHFLQLGGNSSITTRVTVGGNHSVGGDQSPLDGTGTYELADGSLTSSELFVGPRGIGTFTHTRGTNTVTTLLTIGGKEDTGPFGPIASGIGTYTLEPLSVLNAYREVIGFEGEASFIQTGGSNIVDTQLIMAEHNSTSFYDFRDGILRANEALIGLRGTGEFIQSGGQTFFEEALLVGGQMLFADEPLKRGHGIFRLSHGELATPFLAIGQHGQGTFAQTGGLVNIERQLDIAGHLYGHGQGQYILDSGTLLTGDVRVAFNGTGIFTQNGGAHIVAHNLELTSGTSTTSIYNLNLGSLSVSDLITNRGEFNFRGGELFVTLFSNGGAFNPVGIQTLTGDYTSQFYSTLSIELKNETSDSLIIRGSASLDAGSRINVTLADGFEPNTGDTFDILTAGHLSGFENATFELPELPLKEIRTYLVDNTIQLRVMSGNFDGDNDIDFSDLMIFAGTFGLCEGDPGYLPSADYDADGCITFLDYSIWFGYFQNQ